MSGVTVETPVVEFGEGGQWRLHFALDDESSPETQHATKILCAAEAGVSCSTMWLRHSGQSNDTYTRSLCK